MRKVYYDNDIMKYVNFYIPQRYIDMIDELSYQYAKGNRTQMLIRLIEEKCAVTVIREKDDERTE